MALVIVSGLACSGRTRRSKELISYFEHRNREEEEAASTTSTSSSSLRVLHLQNKDANIEKTQFSTQIQEKPARSAYLSMVMRNLAKNTIVIADGGAGTNIKGFRYQLWCAAREVGVRCVSILCVSTPDTCRKRNGRRHSSYSGGANDEVAYEEKTLEELLMRFEEPNPMTRWDSPLFVIDCNPAALTTDEGEQEDEGKETWENAPLDAIWDAITKGKVSKAPDVVAPIRGTSTNYLSLLESTTQLVLSSFQEIISFGNLPEMGGLVQLSINFSSSDASKVSLPFYLPVGKKAPTTASLQRLRRQFIKMHASGASAGNELGHLLGKEGSSLPSHPSFNGRAERKFQRNNGPAMKESNQPKSIEEQLARRFIAYLEETL